jgi:hypothetical protein
MAEPRDDDPPHSPDPGSIPADDDSQPAVDALGKPMLAGYPVVVARLNPTTGEPELIRGRLLRVPDGWLVIHPDSPHGLYLSRGEVRKRVAQL